MRLIVILLGSFLLFNSAYAKRKIVFYSSDGLAVTADLYYVSEAYPFVVFLHQKGYSRGEYNDIADKILNLNYNGLAVDLRVGGEVNYIENETAVFANEKEFPTSLEDIEKDIKAAIDYAYERTDKPVILFGSSFSASLSLKIAIQNPKVQAVIAFNPANFAENGFTLKDQMKYLDKPLFIATNDAEKSHIDQLLKNKQNDDDVTLFLPNDGKGEHGAKALWETSVNSKEYWFALSLFFSGLQK